MSKKYIGQVDNHSFIYPNNNLAEYATEIIHDINNNSVTGTVSGVTMSFSGSNINLTFSYTWNKNNAETFIDGANRLHLLSIHVMDPSKKYFKPWRMVDYVYTTNTTGTTASGSVTVSITPSLMEVSSLQSGNYYLEFRFIGHRAIFPICQNVNVAPPPSPTPTPTNTPGLVPSQTPTNTMTPTPTKTPNATPAASPTYNFYPITLRLVGSDGRNGSLTVYQSNDGITFNQSAQITVSGNDTTEQGFNGTPGYYYYFTVAKTSGATATLNAYVDATPNLSPDVDGAWCSNPGITLSTDVFQLPSPVQITTSFVWFGSITTEGCL
jgi:hypothetical protein